MNDIKIPAPENLADHVATLESEDETRATLREELKALGVVSVEVTYNGSGDEGNIDEIMLSISETSKLRGEADLELRIDSWAWDFICGHHSGFQDNDGGFGTLTWDMASGAITLDHNDYVQESVQTLHEGV